MLKYRLQIVRKKKSVLEFQLEYLEFKFQYGELRVGIRRFSHEKGLKNIEKAELPHGKSRSAVTKIQHFPAKSKLC